MEHKKKGRRVVNALIALVIALGLWLYVVNVENPTGRANLRDLDVVLQGQSQLQEKGLMVTDLSQEKIDLRVTGRKKTLMKLSAKNVSLLLDVSGIEGAGEWPLNCRTSFPANVSTDNVTLADWEDLQVTVTVQEIETKEVPVQGEFIGTVQTGYMAGEVDTDVDTVEITGPSKTLDQIDCALAQIGGESVESTLREESTLVLTAANGDAVDGKGISCSTNNVWVTVPVEKVSGIHLQVNFQDAVLTEKDVRWIIDPDYIAVVDEPGKEAPEDLIIGTIDLGGIYTDMDCCVPVQTPEGFQGWNVPPCVTVHVSTNRITSRLMELEDIIFVNAPEGYHVEQISPKIYVWVWGATRQITALEEDRLSAVVDLSGVKRQTDTIQRMPAKITVRGAYNYVDVLGDHYTVALKLSK